MIKCVSESPMSICEELKYKRDRDNERCGTFFSKAVILEFLDVDLEAL